MGPPRPQVQQHAGPIVQPDQTFDFLPVSDPLDELRAAGQKNNGPVNAPKLDQVQAVGPQERHWHKHDDHDDHDDYYPSYDNYNNYNDHDDGKFD